MHYPSGSLDNFPASAATADALHFFDTLNAGPHGANNGALYDANKHPKAQFKVAGGNTQQLKSRKHLHHGYSEQVFWVSALGFWVEALRVESTSTTATLNRSQRGYI